MEKAFCEWWGCCRKNPSSYNINTKGKMNSIDSQIKKVFTSFYMDSDLAVEVNNIASRGEKGDKSKLINKAIRSLLEQYGAIEKK